MSTRRSVEQMMAAIEREKKINLQRNLSCSTVEVYLPKFYFWAALICGSVNLSVGILGLFLTRDIMGYIAAGYFGLWAFVCGFLLWVSKVWNIVVCRDKGYFYYTTVFNKVYKCNFNECEVLCNTKNRIVLKAKNKKFYIDPHSINIEVLMFNLNKSI